jgi:pseudouridine synthase
MAQERLQKLIARAGLASRRKAERLIQDGRVTINGQKTIQLGIQVDPDRDRIAVDGKALLPTAEPATYVLFKPRGVITSTRDSEGRRDLGEWLKPLKRRGRFFPVGRLDFHSEGLLLLTTDGELANRLAHPRYGVMKCYLVKIRGVPTEAHLGRLRAGIQLDDGLTAPAEVRVKNAAGGKSWIEMKIHEGRNRQVRRMCAALGYPVEKLIRFGYGPLNLGRMRSGEIRPLTPREVKSLKNAAGLGPGSAARNR